MTFVNVGFIPSSLYNRHVLGALLRNRGAGETGSR